MRQKEISLNIRPLKPLDEDFEDDHIASSIETPLRPDAFDLDDDVKIERIEKHFREIMNILGLDLTDDSLKGTPRRVAKMYVKEVFSGLNPKNRPVARLFENKYNYDQMLVEKDITFYSHCEHHFVPIYGKAHVAYFSSGKVIGLSKDQSDCSVFFKTASGSGKINCTDRERDGKRFARRRCSCGHRCKSYVRCIPRRWRYEQ